MFVLNCSLCSEGNSNNISFFWHTLDSAVYNCPWVNMGVHKSQTTLSRVSPWQELNVAYAGRNGSCQRFIVQAE